MENEKPCISVAITDERKNMLKFIDEYIKEHKEGPSQSEIMTACDIKHQPAVVYRLNTLEKHNLIKRKPDGYVGKQPPRYLKIVEENRHFWDN